jgi:peptidoglycan hydrolase-like protein with peptidoglycan-binding domain
LSIYWAGSCIIIGNMPKKLFSVFGVALFVSVLIFSSVGAQTVSELQAQLQSLLQKVTELQAQLDSGQTNMPSAVTQATGDGVYYFVPNQTLYRGLNDSETGGQVSELQKFLTSLGDIVYPEKLVTGYYGLLTEKAVQRWQAIQGVVSSGTPASNGYGVVGPKTRIAMQEFVDRTKAFIEVREAESVASSNQAQSSPTANSGETFQGFVSEVPPARSGAPVIYSVSPRSGPRGTRVTIKGNNFTRTGNTVMIGYATLKNVSSLDGKTITYVHNPPVYDSPDEFDGYVDAEQFTKETLDPLGITWAEFLEESKEENWIYIFNANGESKGAVFYGELDVKFINPHFM